MWVLWTDRVLTVFEPLVSISAGLARVGAGRGVRSRHGTGVVCSAEDASAALGSLEAQAAAYSYDHDKQPHGCDRCDTYSIRSVLWQLLGMALSVPGPP